MAGDGSMNILNNKYRAVTDALFYICLTVFVSAALIRDCETSFWTSVLLNPVISEVIIIVDFVLLPLLALYELIFGMKGEKIQRCIIVFVTLLTAIVQIKGDMTALMGTGGILKAFLYPGTMERGLWIYSNAHMFRLGLVFLVTAANGKDFNKIAKVYLISQTVLMVLITVLSLTGVIPDLVYEVPGRAGRHSLGMHYPLNYISHWFSIALVYCFIKKGILKVWDYALLVALTAVSALVCKAQTATVLLVVLIAGTFIRQFRLSRGKTTDAPRLKYLLQYSFQIFAVLTIVFSMLYVPPVSTFFDSFPRLNTFFSRFAFGRVGLLTYFPTHFGTDYPISTWTDTVANEDYFFIDSSYITELIHCGVLLYPVMMGLLWYITNKLYLNKNGYGLMLLALFACTCTMEYHLAEVSFNIFWLLILADIGGQPTEVTALSSPSKSTS